MSLPPASAAATPPASRRAGRRRRILVRITATGRHTTLLALAVLFLAPLLWTAWASVRGPRAAGGAEGVGLDNYRRLAEYGAGLPQYTANSLVVSLLTVAGTLTAATLGGYAAARFRFPGRDLLFLVTLGILMVPYPTLLVPLYVLLGRLGLENSHLGLALVLTMFQLPFALFMMRNAFDGVPRDLDEAALIDGCGPVRTLVRVLIPVVVPAMVTVGLFAFLASWNEFIAPLMLLSDDSLLTLPTALAAMRSSSHGAIDFGALQAGVIVSAVPCTALFLLLQRHYVRGFTSGALKG
ncbi:carbohydrate ABC transporter permease [Allonocardiopsis opalescens]|uniref:Multiple sugar transport system permease protein n=1 Tax=Allonocardiopsis opalescens TaxID=1144618 RepID=A0A2T0PYE2_9ACTN|nr:carbohydrate ABC transporter permease [Allonocardiopsis opalescens]PRX96561.1 multiple sugar transport system permease protein [Allonocardiopsis opalescens]